MSEWISVKERLPSGDWGGNPHFSDMQLVANSAGVDIAFYSRATNTWYCDCPAECVEWIDKITHWMPLPKPPEPKP